MKSIIIARVLTEEQKEAGNSLPAQQERLRAYIVKKPVLRGDKKLLIVKGEQILPQFDYP